MHTTHIHTHTRTHARTHARTHGHSLTHSNTHTHSHTYTHTVVYQGNGTEEMIFEKRNVFKEDLKELNEAE